jgi:hypothetical protein
MTVLHAKAGVALVSGRHLNRWIPYGAVAAAVRGGTTPRTSIDPPAIPNKWIQSSHVTPRSVACAHSHASYDDVSRRAPGSAIARVRAASAPHVTCRHFHACRKLSYPCWRAVRGRLPSGCRSGARWCSGRPPYKKPATVVPLPQLVPSTLSRSLSRRVTVICPR